MGVNWARVGVAALPGRGRGKTPLLARASRSTWEFVHVCTLSAYTLVISRTISVHDYACLSGCASVGGILSEVVF